MRPPRFRRVPFIRNGVSDHGRAVAPRVDGAQHVAFDVINRLGLCNIISFAAQYPTPHGRCVRFAPAVTDDHATLATGRHATALPSPDFHRLERASFAWRTDNRFLSGPRPLKNKFWKVSPAPKRLLLRKVTKPSAHFSALRQGTKKRGDLQTHGGPLIKRCALCSKTIQMHSQIPGCRSPKPVR